MYKVRFNLGRGDNFKKWKVTGPDKEVQYLDPEKVSLVLIKSTLFNKKASAEKIHNGHNKFVCAWVKCEDLQITDKYKFNDNLTEISYNPKVAPHWQDVQGKDIDGKYFGTLRTLGNKVFEVVHGANKFQKQKQ
jgi:hypothetical protein